MPRPPTDPRAAAPDKKPQREPKEKQERSWLGDAMRALFVRQVRVKRVDGKLGVALDKSAPQQAGGAAAASPMRAELKALLDAAPQSRLSLRVLGAVEHGLKHKDPTGLFLFEVEPARLRVALRQLDGLAPAKPSAGLAALRARIVDAVTSREKKQKRLEMIAPRSDLMRDQRVEVAEVGPTDFDRLQAQWKGGSSAS
jgi:hypothetical protein